MILNNTKEKIIAYTKEARPGNPSKLLGSCQDNLLKKMSYEGYLLAY